MNHIWRNHIAPQFYLKHWADKNEQVWSYNVARKEYNHTTTNEIGFIKDTYTDEIEKLLSKEEDKIAKAYDDIIDTLVSSKISPFALLPVLNLEQTRLLYRFFYIQRFRSVSGRLTFARKNVDTFDILSDSEAMETAEGANEKLAECLKNISDDRIAQFMDGKYVYVMKTVTSYPFWTSSCPVYLCNYDDIGFFDKMFAPRFETREPDTAIMALSPLLLLIVSLKQIPGFERLSAGKLFVMPMNTFDRKNYTREKKINVLRWGVDWFNLSLLQGYEPQTNKRKNKADPYSRMKPRGSNYCIVAQKFSHDDKRMLECTGIQDRDEVIKNNETII